MTFPSLFGLSFANPWFLAAFLILPLLYFLLRVLPPPPKQVKLATAHFLGNLTTQSRSSSKTPWWILLLRLMILTLIILAFAGPFKKGELANLNETPLLLVLDNGWTSAKNWSEATQKADALLESATAHNIAVIVALTTPLPGKTSLEIRGPSEPQSLKAFINAATPQPIEAQFPALYQELKDTDFKRSIFISSAIGGAGASGLLDMMGSKGPLDVITPANARSPLLLQSLSGTEDAGFSLQKSGAMRVLSGVPQKSASQKTLLGYGAKGDALYQIPFSFEANALSQDVYLKTIDAALLQKTAILRIADESTAGATYLLGQQSGETHAGIALSGHDNDGRDLASSATYPAKALEPYAKISLGSLSELLKNADQYNFLILPDIASAPPSELETLTKWIKKGGTLLRFGGPKMSRNNTLPVPVPLRSGERALGGSISWEGKQKLAAFPPQSPFQDISVDEDITVQKQILAAPLQSDDPAIWAVLEDGTPFITAKQEGRGMIVMIHSSADPAWSDFALSGLYVKILKRLAELSDAPAQSFTAAGQSSDLLKPLQVLDGFGQLITPPPFTESLKISDKETPRPASLTPPGLYGTASHPYSLNLGDALSRPDPISAALPQGANVMALNGENKKDYKTPLLMGAFLLFLLDWLLIIYILRLSEWRRALPHLGRAVKRTGLSLILSAVFLGVGITDVKAQTSDTQSLVHINALSLAYIKTGESDTDHKVELGLTTLADVLKQRTSVEPDGVVALDPQKDSFLFYPFIYWAVTSTQAKLSDQSIIRLQNYIDHGGLLILDTGYPSSAGEDSLVLQNFMRKIDGLNLPPLHRLPKNHTLKRSFYLLDTLQGRESNSNIWVSYDPSAPEASVGSVLIGGNDWAGGWTGLGVRSPQDQEMALRAGVNITMYALTGNYKSDQLHLDTIMKRLGQ